MLYVILSFVPFLVAIGTIVETTSATSVRTAIETSSSQSSPRDGRAMLQHLSEATIVEVGQRAEPTTLSESREISSNIDDAFARAEALDNALTENNIDSKIAQHNVTKTDTHTQTLEAGRHQSKYKTARARSAQTEHNHSLQESQIMKHAATPRNATHPRDSFVEVGSGDSKRANSTRNLREVDRMLIGNNMSIEIKSLSEAKNMSRNMDDAFAQAEAMDSILSGYREDARAAAQDKRTEIRTGNNTKTTELFQKAKRSAELARNRSKRTASTKARTWTGSIDSVVAETELSNATSTEERLDHLQRPKYQNSSELLAKALGLPKALQLVQIEDVARSVTAKYKSKGKAEPMGIAKWIKDQMIPQTELTKIEMGKEVARAAAAVDACESVLQATDKDADKREVTVRTAEARYKECNASLATLISDQELACQDLQEYSDRLDIPTCLDRVYRHSTELMESTLRKNWEFFNLVYPQFTEKKKLCEDMKISREGKSTQCVREQRLLEGALCALRSARKSACEEYAACRETMVDRFNKAKTDVKILEEKTKDEYKSLHRIECFISILVEGEQIDAQEAAAQNCNPDSVDVTHLSIDYPSPGAANSCETVIATSEDYSSLECPAELEESSDVTSVEESVQAVDSDEGGDTEEKTEDVSGAEKTEKEAALSQLVPQEPETLQLDQRVRSREAQKWTEKRRLSTAQRQMRARRQRRQYAYDEGNSRLSNH